MLRSIAYGKGSIDILLKCTRTIFSKEEMMMKRTFGYLSSLNVLIKSVIIAFVSMGLPFIFPQSTFAAPAITGVSGTISQGQSIAIVGSGFGAKTSAQPVYWDDLEDGAADLKAKIGTWEDDANRILVINTTNQRHSNSRYNAMANFNGSHNMDNAKFQGGSDTTKWFVQYWVKLDSNFSWGNSIGGNLGNVKFIRFWTTGSGSNDFVCSYHGGTSAGCATENCDDSYPGYFSFKPTNITKNVWHLFQFEFNSSSIGTRDGTFRMYYDGALVENWSIKTKCSGASSNFRPQVIGWFNSTDSGASGSKQVYFDDFYADSTWARIEIGNASTYAASTRREIQIPSSWANTGITVSVNTGGFASNENVYLYVVDSNGAVNANGYPIKIGAGSSGTDSSGGSGGSETTPLSSPTGLHIVGN